MSKWREQHFHGDVELVVEEGIRLPHLTLAISQLRTIMAGFYLVKNFGEIFF